MQVGNPITGKPDEPLSVNKEGSKVVVTFEKKNPNDAVEVGPVEMKVCKGIE